jgi:hypothetical protein
MIRIGRSSGPVRTVLVALGLLLSAAPLSSAEPPASDDPPETEAPPWFEWGADLRLRGTYIRNHVTLDRDDPINDWNWLRQRARVWSRIAPDESLEFNLRAAWEGKYFDKPDAFDTWNPTSVVLDRVNVRWTDDSVLPFTLQAGRQELMAGDGWLLMDGAPLVGSSYFYFDSVRATATLDEIDTEIDVAYIDQDAEGDGWIPPIYDRDIPITEQDEIGAVVQVVHRSIPRTRLDGYFLYKNDDPVLANGNEGEIYTVGGGGEYRFDERTRWSGTVAVQFGDRNDRTHQALGALTRLDHDLEDAWGSSLHLDYEYLSGDDPDSAANEAFDILWGRWPRFSEMILYTYIGETRIGDYTNLHRVAAGWSGEPHERLGLRADWQFLFADENTLAGQPGFDESGKFRGQLWTGRASYRFSEHVSGHLHGELFCPGDYTTDDRNDTAYFFRLELMFTW